MVIAAGECEKHQRVLCMECGVSGNSLSLSGQEIELSEEPTPGIVKIDIPDDPGNPEDRRLESAARVVIAGRANRKDPPVLTAKEQKEKQLLQSTAESGGWVDVPCTRILPYNGQPREYFDPTALVKLAAGMKIRGQSDLTKVVWRPESNRYYCELVDGERRLLAAVIAGFLTLRVHIDFTVTDAASHFIASVGSNFNREGHTPLETAKAVERLYKNGMSIREIAHLLGKKEQWIRKYRTLTRLHPHIQAMLGPELPESEQLRVTAALQLAILPREHQLTVLKEIGLGRGSGSTEAFQTIRTTALGMGIRTSRRSPADDHKIFRTALGALKSRLAALNGMNLEALFGYRDPADLITARDRFDDIEEGVKEFRRKLASISRENSPTQ